MRGPSDSGGAGSAKPRSTVAKSSVVRNRHTDIQLRRRSDRHSLQGIAARPSRPHDRRMENDLHSVSFRARPADQWAGAIPPSGRLRPAIERLGFDSIWANDSLVATDRSAHLPVRRSRGHRRVMLGTAALQPALRRPVQTAQVLASIDRLSRGRFTVAGRWPAPRSVRGRIRRIGSSLAAAVRPTRRHVALWRHLWTGSEPNAFHGKVLHFDDIPRGITPFRAARVRRCG